MSEQNPFGLVELGRSGSLPSKDLETFPNPGVRYVKLESSEFTSLCPVTNQPDWGTVKVEYVPDKLCLESKSFKLFLGSYRNEGHFCEALAVDMANRISEALGYCQVCVTVIQTPRGGVGIEAIAEVNDPDSIQRAQLTAMFEAQRAAQLAQAEEVQSA